MNAPGPSAPKAHRRGTDRLVTPAETLRAVAPLMARAGITRVANVTGLDTIGIPVVAVYRPNSRSLAVFQGKGLDLDAARASGVMEAIEAFHAEHVAAPLRLASWNELRRAARVVNAGALPRLSVSTFHADRQLLWIEGRDLATEAPTWLPYEMVHSNFSLPLPTGSGAFVMSSNGLASGNHPLEAVSHAICELVERDANALWSAGGGAARHDRRLDLRTVDDGDAQQVLARLHRAGVAVGVWNTTTDIGLASFRCVVVDRDANHLRQRYFAFGSGCHPVRRIALLRALTEAVQCRLTYIAGARDDASRDFFERARNPDRVARLRERVEEYEDRGCDFRAVPNFDSPDFRADVDHERACLAGAGLEEVIAVDLTLPGFAIPVVRVVIPGLESLHDAPGYVPGARARGQICFPQVSTIRGQV